MEDTGTQILMAGLKMGDFDDSPYSLMFLKNAIQNKETTADHRSDTIFTSSTSNKNIFNQAKGAINLNWVLINHQSTVYVIFNPKLLNNIQITDLKMNIFFNAGVKTTDTVVEMP